MSDATAPKSPVKRSDFADAHAEFYCLAGVARYGRDAMLDCDQYLVPNDFQNENNQNLYAAFAEYHREAERPIDWPSLVSAATRLGLKDQINRRDVREHFASMRLMEIDAATVAAEASKLLKLRVARQLDERLARGRRSLHQITGDEMLAEIIACVEDPIYDLTSRINSGDNDIRRVGQGAIDWVLYNVEHPQENIGIPSPFPEWNRQLGGGLRRGTVTVVAARPKVGKTHFVNCNGLHFAGTLGVPTLNLDTELSQAEHWPRLLGNMTGIEGKRIEQGRLDAAEVTRIREACRRLETIPFYHKRVIDEIFEEHVAAIRRWVSRDVGVTPDGVTRDCVVIYDYLQLTDPKEFGGNKFAEYQILGFQMVALTRIAKRYDIPLLVFVQLTKEGATAGSDRILWKCSSLSYLEKKEEEEMQALGGKGEGTLWLKNKAARHGPGSDGPEDDISIIFEKATSVLREGKTRAQLFRSSSTNPGRPDDFSFIVDQDAQLRPISPPGNSQGAGEPWL